MAEEKKFDSERDKLSQEELQALDILDRVHKHELTAFGGLMEMIKMIEGADVETPSEPVKVPE